LAEGVTAESQIGWADEFRIGLCGSVRRVLAPRGVKVRQRVELVRDWYDLAVVVDGRKGRLFWSWIEGMKGVQIAAAVEEWRSEGFEALVWDGHGGHRTKTVRDSGMLLVEQPAASPELNPAELIGQSIRAETEGKVYGTIWRKMAAVETVLERFSADPEAVKRLTGWGWILQSCHSLPHKGSE
jgi:hypothetical protein